MEEENFLKKFIEISSLRLLEALKAFALADLGDHGYESLTLACGKANEHARPEVESEIRCVRAQDGTDDHDSCCSE